CGRLAAFVNHAHNNWYNEKRGFFGFFETVEDEEVVGRLFDAGRAWFAERGIEAIRGPMNPSLNYECGLLVEGFEDAPWFMMTYNKPYYNDFVERFGLKKVKDLLLFCIIWLTAL
ncbi:MAG: N-acetyltransferase, partial [Clostridiales bacterium]|nr:N-acetyltransferase [Clostridiales bacterium]